MLLARVWIKRQQSDMRYVKQRHLVIEAMKRTIEVTLNDRSRMRFRILLGRQAFGLGMTIDPTALSLQPILPIG